MRRLSHTASAALLAATLLLSGCASAHGSATDAGSASSVARAAGVEGRELPADQQIAHALSRLTFGARPGDVTRVRAVGLDRWIAVQLRPERIDDRAAEQMLEAFDMVDASPGEIVELYRRVRQARRRQAMLGDTVTRAEARRRAFEADPTLRDARRRLQGSLSGLQAAKVARAVTSERQLAEVMVDFWENHFSVFAGKGQTRLYLTHYDREVVRPHALGKFRDLLGAVAKSPAMLFYLDNWQSVADSGHATLGGAARSPRRGGAQPRRRRGLNENYARELLELHTLGVDGGYSQRDVIEVARALTGWSIDQRTGGFAFRPAVHDADEKVVLGHTLRGGRGIEDGEQVLDILARHPATARHVARKLAQRFVSDSPPPALVARAAETFRRTDGDIREVVRTIVTSPEFFSRAAYRTKVKSPFELVASALRAVNAAPDATPRTAQMIARLGQPIFGRQTPDGWPETGADWMNAGAILNRINFGLALAGGRVPGATLDRWPHAASLAGANREAQVDAVVRTILGGEASPETWAILRSGENPLAASSTAEVTPATVAGRGVALEGLAQVIGLALGAPEFQRR